MKVNLLAWSPNSSCQKGPWCLVGCEVNMFPTSWMGPGRALWGQAPTDFTPVPAPSLVWPWPTSKWLTWPTCPPQSEAAARKGQASPCQCSGGQCQHAGPSEASTHAPGHWGSPRVFLLSSTSCAAPRDGYIHLSECNQGTQNSPSEAGAPPITGVLRETEAPATTPPRLLQTTFQDKRAKSQDQI